VSLVLSWVLFPLVMGAIGLGWGTIAERAAASRVNGALLVPLGWAAALVVAGTLAAFSDTAPAAAPVVGVGAAVGLLLALPGRRPGRWRLLAWPGRRLSGWPLLAAVGALLAYGAPVLLSGQATFTGFIKLDDTATWFNIVDNVMAHGRSVAGLEPSTYTLNFLQANPAYPLGSFVLFGAGRALTGIDLAWVFQPYMACCGAAVALCLYALMEPMIASARVRALLAFLGAQPALLYGYSLWGGSKELTAAFLLVLGVALAAEILPRAPRPRELIPLALAAGALIQTLGAGAGGWVAPAFALVVAGWLIPGWRAQEARRGLISLAWLSALTAVFLVPVWAVLSAFFSNQGGFLSNLFSSGQSVHTRFGNLTKPVSAFQLVGIWPVGDFRLTPPMWPSALFIGLALILATGALWVGVRRRQFGLPLYLAVALAGCGAIYFSGGTPWVTGKALAISSPALLGAALTAAGMLWGRHRAGFLPVLALAGGVLWSSALAYHDVTLAPRPRLAELQHIGELVAGKGPTFINEYEVYADRHFLREGAPVEPAEYRSVRLELRDGKALTEGAWADLDSFPLATLEAYRSIVTRRSPTESRPPSNYALVWQGAYYQLWQRPSNPSTSILEHVPLGESNKLPYCGATAGGGGTEPLCSIDPVATPPCSQIRSLGNQALRQHADLLAYQRPPPIVVRGDQTLWPGGWTHEADAHRLAPTTPGEAVGHIAVNRSQIYELWLGGNFARGFDVSVDGRHLRRIMNELSGFYAYVHVADLFLASGVHTFGFYYPHPDLTPSSGWNEYTSLAEIALERKPGPETLQQELIRVHPRQATELCERPLDWIELVTGTS
jgi:hypothetical protein